MRLQIQPVMTFSPKIRSAARISHHVLIHRPARLFAQVRWNDVLSGIPGCQQFTL
jgi:hypothetical protein